MTRRDDADPDVESPGLTPGRGEDVDDSQLSSLRAVWLGMPDEDPSERGLAELMAAARVKAEQMARPSLWQRIAALLRRPAVLALASIVVLIGGGLLLGQRRDAVEAEPPSLASEQPDHDLTTTAATGEPNAVAAPADDMPGGTAPAVPVAAPEIPMLIEEDTSPPRAGASDTKRTPPRPTGSTSNDRGRPGTQAAAADSSRDTRNLEDGDVSTGGGLEARLHEQEPAVGADRFAAPPPPAGANADAARAGEAASTDSNVRAGAVARPSRAAQYVAQAKSAAARGDCAAARVIMKRVAKEDAALYRNTLASDAALKKCVAQ